MQKKSLLFALMALFILGACNKDDDEATPADLWDAGATFNRAFKKFTGKSPCDYLSQIENTTPTMLNK